MTPQERRDAVEDMVKGLDPTALFMDGHDGALIGWATQGPEHAHPVYDEALVVKELMERDGMDRDDAREYLDHNISSGWYGDCTPLLLHRLREDED